MGMTNPTLNTRARVLDKARDIVNGEREGQYGSPEDSFKTIADLWSAYLHKEVTPCDVAQMMILLKIARCRTGVYKDDNYIDICGYAACAAEIAEGK